MYVCVGGEAAAAVDMRTSEKLSLSLSLPLTLSLSLALSRSLGGQAAEAAAANEMRTSVQKFLNSQPKTHKSYSNKSIQP